MRLRTKLDGCLTGSQLAKDRAAEALTKVMIPAALDYLDLAEQRFRDLGSRLGFVLADRSELLLSVRLVSEALQAGEQAVREFEHEGQRIALPEARLLLARAAGLAGDNAGAVEQARRAVAEFTRQQRPHWAALARFVLLSSRLGGSERPRVAVRQLLPGRVSVGTIQLHGPSRDHERLSASF